MSELDTLMAEREIRRRLVDCCRGIDRCDAEPTASARHPDAIDDHGSFVGTGHGFATYAARSQAERIEAAFEVGRFTARTRPGRPI